MEDCQKITLQEGITKVLHHMITANAKSPVISSRFHSHSAPAMSIGSYVERIVKYTRCSCEALVGSLMFLQYHVTFSGHCVTVFNVHRTLITSVVLAAKSRDDEYYTNTYYAKIGGIPAAELKTLELDYINLLEWDCWLDRDAFDETVAMLTELATTNPSPSEIAQAVTFWEDKQSRFARNRRKCVREAIEMDIDIERRKVLMLQQQQPNSGNASTSSYHSNNYPQQQNNNNNISNAMGSSVGSDHQQHLERLAFGGNTPVSHGSGAAAVPSSAFKDPTAGSMMGSASSSSNLIVTAPCFYPKGMRAPATANNTANTNNSVKQGLGSNPYQQQQPSSYDGLSSYVSPYQSNNTNSSGRTLNPYGNWGTNNTNNNNNNGTAPKASSYYGAGLSGASSAFPSQPIQSKPPSTPTSANGGNASSWAAVAASVNTTPNTASTRSNRGGGTNNSNNNLLLAPNSAAKANNNNNSCKSDQTLSHNNSITLPPSPTAQSSRSPTYIPQGAPGFNTAVSLNPAAVAAAANNNNNNNMSSTSSNSRVLTKNRFNGSGDSLNGSSGLQNKTPESSRYSIVGINANQHPNSYYSYTTESNQHQHMTHSPTSARGGAAGRLASGGKSSTVVSSPNSASTSAFPSVAGTGGRSGNKNNNGLWRSSNPNINTGSSDSVNNSERGGGGGGGGGSHTTSSPGIKLSAADVSAAAEQSPSSYDQNLVAAKSQHNNNNGDDEDDGTVPFERAGSKRRQTGKKREVPSHWQDDR